MSEELISEYVDTVAIKAHTDFLLSEFARAKAGFDKLNKSRKLLGTSKTLPDISSNIRQADKDTQNLVKSQAQLSAANDKAALIEARINTEREKAAAIRRKSIIEQDKELERLIALEEKELAIVDKKNANDSVNAGKERILQFKAEQAELERLAEAERARDEAEQKALSGTFNPGTIPKPTSTTAAIPLTVGQGDIVLLKTYESEIAKLTKEQTLSKSAFLSGKITQAEYQREIALSTQKITALKTNVSDLTREMKLNAAVNDSERNSLGRAQALIAQYTNEKKKLNLATADGVLMNNNYNKAIEKSNAFILKNADAETVRAKSVGQYTNGIQKAFSGLRTLANILPGIGLSGLFLAGFEGVKVLIEALGIFNSRLSDTQRQREILLNIEKESTASYGKEAGELKILRATIESTEVPMATRLQAVKDLQKLMPEQFAGLTKEALLTGNVANAYDLAAAAILRKARAQAASTQIEANSAKDLKIVQEGINDAQETNAKLKDASSKTTVDEFGNTVNVAKQTNKLLVDAFNINENLRKQERQEIKKDTDFLLKFAVEGAAATIKIDKEKAAAKTAVTKDSTKTSLDSEFELFKIAQQRKIKLLQDESNDEKLSFDKRISLLNDYNAARLLLIDKQLEDDLRKNDEKEAALQANLKKAKGTERNNLLIEIANNQNTRKVLEAKSNSDQLAVFDEHAKAIEDKTLKENERLFKIQTAHYNRALQLLEDQKNKEKAILDNKFSSDVTNLQASFDKGLISQRELNKERLKIEYEYAIASLQIEIDRINNIIRARAIFGFDVSKEQAAVAKLEKDIADKSFKNFQDLQKLKREEVKKTLDAIQDISSKAFSLIDGLLNANEISQKNKLKEQSDAAEKKAARDIELVNASVLSEQDKAAKIIVINARLAAQKEAIARREKQIEHDRAVFQKAQNIFNIILSTAQAIIKQLATTPLPLGAPLVALVAALGAAQLAIAIKTPVPKFYRGKNLDNYEGPAIVNDGSKPEVIERADGTLEFPQGRNVLTHVGKKDIIHPDKDAWLNAILNAAHRDANASMKFTPAKNNVEDKINATLVKGFAGLSNTIKNKREIIIRGVSGKDIMFRDGSNSTTYLNNSLQ